jgi:hypothetical protein
MEPVDISSVLSGLEDIWDDHQPLCGWLIFDVPVGTIGDKGEVP